MNKHRNRKKFLEKERLRLHEIIFEAETPAGKLFDLLLIISIILSVLIVMLDSMKDINDIYGNYLYILEWSFTIIFTLEYILRLFCIGKPFHYIFSFFGIVDFLAILPTYISLFFPGSQFLGIVRVLRLLRVFRVLKLVQYLSELQHLTQALYASRRKIEVFLYGVITLMVILGTLMYVIEGEENGFTSIPKSIYWAIVTMTTVGYGDIYPKTSLGQTLASIVMIIGYSIIAVPTGIITAELTQIDSEQQVTTISCHQCSAEGHDRDALFCKFCGASLYAPLKH
jgi:voltage-gated potassium channel